MDVSDAPEGDIFALARRYRGVDAEPLPLGDVFPDEAVGDARSFQGLDLDRDRVFTFDAEVMHVSANASWWFPPGSDVDPEDVRSAAREFEERILPGVVGLVAPGLELPGRIAVVHADYPGVAGYFNGADALPAAVAPISNERVALYMAIPPSSEPFTRLYYYGVLAHELQHLVHWFVDPSEDAWAQEALSELAARQLGYPGIPFEPYLRRPEVSVTDWPADVEQALPNYAGASLFAAYLTERLGGDFPARLAAQPADGAEGVEAASPGDDFRGLYADWLTANVARAPAPPYGYESLTGSPVVRRSLREPGTLAGRAPQYGQWLLDLRPDAPWEVTFASGGPAPLLPDAPPGGGSCWWSNRGNGVDSTLTRALDLTGAARAELTFRAWWQIEEHWDHAYVAVSDDGGATWAALPATSTSTRDPFRTAFGPSYTGASGGWREERVDLSAYAGREALLRFELVTDGAVHHSGICIDDVAVPAAGVFDDAESDDPGWRADGFLRIGGAAVRQDFALRLVEGKGEEAVVTSIAVGADRRAEFRVEERATLIVIPFAEKTSVAARFMVAAGPPAP